MRAFESDWSILPLSGKYYGTKVNIGDSEITVWTPDYNELEPSIREIDDGWTPDVGFDHVEDVQSFAIAQLIHAAPDLLTALKQLIAKHGFNDDGTEKDWQEYKNARLAIELATNPKVYRCDA